ncbi:MAG: hypothetical protein OYM47_03655 [Gemmatimonadota bacterium]|nr:hypothetical protein [Gemmatimonadota bacterium]
MPQHDVFELLDLSPYFNQDGISSDEDRTDGDFAGTGRTYPAEDLPSSNSIMKCDDVLFSFPDKRNGARNIVSLEGQRIQVPGLPYESLHLLGVSGGTSLEDTVRFLFSDGVSEVAFLGLSSWRRGHDLKYGERVAIQCTGFHLPARHVYTDKLDLIYGIWMQTVPVRSCKPLVTIELPYNPGMHIFSMTLRRRATSNCGVGV